MLRLIKGRAGSGKTKYIENEFVSRVKNGDDGLVLIVPEQFSFECERMFLRSLNASQASRIDVLSFTRMATRLIDEYGCKGKFIDRGKHAVAMSLALLGVEDELEIYKSRNGRFDFVDGLVGLMGELKHNCVTPEKLIQARNQVKGSVLRKKLAEASLISEAYSAVMSDMFYDSEDRFDILYDLVLKSECFKGKTVAIDSFKGFTRQELKIIGLIAEQADDLIITLCCDGTENEKDKLLFGCVYETEQKLIKTARLANVAVAKPVVLGDVPRFKNDELKELEKNVFRVGAQKREGKCENVELRVARDIYDECRWVARRIKKLLREEKLRARDIAVIYRDDAYAQILSDVLKRYEIPVFEDNRQPLSTQPLLVFVKHLFTAVRSGYNSEEIFKYLKSGLAGLDAEQISLLENYAYVWQISGSAWGEEWTNNPKGFEEMHDYDLEKLGKINALRERVIAPLKNFRQRCKNATALEISTAVFELFRQIDVRGGLLRLAVSLDEQGESVLALEQETAWKFVMRALDDMVNMLGDRKINIETYEKLFSFLVNASDFGRLPSGLDEVELGNADRIRTSNPRAVFVVGLNDGEFPRTQMQSGIFTDFERKELSKLDENLVDDGEYRLAEERFFVYSSLCCASEWVFASYHKVGVDGKTKSPSEAVSQIKSVFTELEAVSCAEADALEYLCSQDSAFDLMTDKWADNDEISVALKKYFSCSDRYSPIMGTLDKIVKNEDYTFKNPELSKGLFGENIYISASKAETFHNCRFGYFCKHGMKVQGRTVATLDAMQSGNVVHYVLEHLLKKYKKSGLISADFKSVSADIDELMTEYLNIKMGGEQDKNSRFMYLFRRLKGIINEVVKFTIEEFSQSDFEFADFELKINNDGDISPLRLPLPDGGSVNVDGSVDRVDIYKKDDACYIRVVDYKTGKKEFRLYDVMGGLNMQMLIYLDCICKSDRKHYGENVEPAGVLYMRSKREYTKMSGSDVKKTVNSVMDGLIVENIDVVKAMEHEVEGRYVPVKYDGKALKGNLITAGRMDKLLERIEDTLIKMGEALHSGDVAAYPLGKSQSELPCRYCDYKSVCLKDGSYFKEKKRFTDSEVFGLLDGGEGRNGD